MSLIERKTGVAYRRLGPRLTSDEIVARASDVEAATCRVCNGEGFLNTEHLCPQCFGSGAVLVPKKKPQPAVKIQRAAHGRAILGWALFFLVIAGVFLYWILR